jgi:prophage regulatory protein
MTEYDSGTFLRIKDILKIIPVCASTWWIGVRKGIYPKPIKLGVRITVWRKQDIYDYIEKNTPNQ